MNGAILSAANWWILWKVCKDRNTEDCQEKLKERNTENYQRQWPERKVRKHKKFSSLTGQQRHPSEFARTGKAVLIPGFWMGQTMVKDTPRLATFFTFCGRTPRWICQTAKTVGRERAHLLDICPQDENANSHVLILCDKKNKNIRKLLSWSILPSPGTQSVGKSLCKLCWLHKASTDNKRNSQKQNNRGDGILACEISI